MLWFTVFVHALFTSIDDRELGALWSVLERKNSQLIQHITRVIKIACNFCMARLLQISYRKSFVSLYQMHDALHNYVRSERLSKDDDDGNFTDQQFTVPQFSPRRFHESHPRLCRTFARFQAAAWSR
jgi:hypothetical protein